MDPDLILIRRFMMEHSKEAARTMEDVEPESLANFLNESPIDWLLEVIPHMNPQSLSEVFERMNPLTLAKLFESMEMDQMLRAIRRMNKDLSNRIMKGISPEKSAAAERLLKYLDYSAGAHMDTRIFTLTEHLSVKEAMAAVKKHSGQIQPQLFVLDSGQKYAGAISLSDLVSGDPDQQIRSMINASLSTLSPETPIHSLVNRLEWQDFYALPVVDPSNIFLGAIRLETIRSLLVQSGHRKEEMEQLAISALGELYHLGLAGLIKSATNIEPLSKE